jgi:hypothetical protein
MIDTELDPEFPTKYDINTIAETIFEKYPDLEVKRKLVEGIVNEL